MSCFLFSLIKHYLDGTSTHDWDLLVRCGWKKFRNSLSKVCLRWWFTIQSKKSPLKKKTRMKGLMYFLLEEENLLMLRDFDSTWATAPLKRHEIFPSHWRPWDSCLISLLSLSTGRLENITWKWWIFYSIENAGGLNKNGTATSPVLFVTNT